jgi:hypothetical protein
MTPLEDELVAGMRERTAGLVPAPDLIDRAVRGNRRRRARYAAATGGLGVAAVLAIVIATLGSPRPSPPAGPAAQPAPKMLTVAEISARAMAALASDDVEHAKITIAQPGLQSTVGESWYDSVTGNSRNHGIQAKSGDRLEDTWTIRRDDTATVTDVNHADRTWWTLNRPDDNDKTGSRTGYTPEELRDQLSDGEWQLVGYEQVNGRRVAHLQQIHGSVSTDLWVDADTFRMVRRQIVKAANLTVTITQDFDWLTRTPEALRPFSLAVPSGYRQIAPSEG